MSIAQRFERRCRVAAVSLFSLFTLAACGLPAAGPTAGQLEASLSSDDFDVKLVNVDSRVAAILHRTNSLGLGGRFVGVRYVAKDIVHPGDTLAITVYESGGSSLFGGSTPQQPTSMPIATGAGVSTIPPQVVESDGTIFMPFVGRIKVSGETPSEIARMITEKLQGKTVEPQVIVSNVGKVGSMATVGGDVNQPRSIALTLRGERLLDVIAAAGGTKFPAYESYVRIIRGSTIGTVLLQTVLNNPAENVAIKPGDQVFVIHNPRTFAVLGATQKVSQFTFDTEKVTLAEAIARAGGPIDTVGDPTGIFLFRFEPFDVAKQVLGEQAIDAMGGSHPEFVPILYRVGLTNADGFFVAQAIEMRDKDVVLITNAPATQLQKLMAIVRSFTGVAYDLRRSSGY